MTEPPGPSPISSHRLFLLRQFQHLVENPACREIAFHISMTDSLGQPERGWDGRGDGTERGRDVVPIIPLLLFPSPLYQLLTPNSTPRKTLCLDIFNTLET